MKIDKDVPIPSRGKSELRKLLEKMEVGDSVLTDGRSYARNTAHRVLGTGCYTIRKEEQGYRIWRIK